MKDLFDVVLRRMIDGFSLEIHAHRTLQRRGSHQGSLAHETASGGSDISICGWDGCDNEEQLLDLHGIV